MNDKYKLAITFAYLGLAALLIVVVGAIALFRPDATATMIGFGGTILTGAITATVTFYMLGKQNEKLGAIEKQTNGNLSAAHAEIAKLRKAAATEVRRKTK